MEKENRGRPNMPPPSRSSQAKSRDVGASALELHLPNLALFGFAEGLVRLFLDDLHARRGVNAAGAQKHTVGPELHPGVAGGAGEGDALGDQRLADAEPSSPRLNIEQAQPGDTVTAIHPEHRTPPPAGAPGHPALPPPRPAAPA